jgi:hypothetical protein
LEGSLSYTGINGSEIGNRKRNEKTFEAKMSEILIFFSREKSENCAKRISVCFGMRNNEKKKEAKRRHPGLKLIPTAFFILLLKYGNNKS